MQRLHAITSDCSSGQFCFARNAAEAVPCGKFVNGHSCKKLVTAVATEKHMLHSEAGGALIETALVIPVFMLLIFGLINFAMVLFGACNIAYASRSAVRYACLHSGTSNVPATTATITGLITPYIYAYPSNTWSPTLTYSGTGNQIGNTAKISITITYNISMPFFKYSGLKLTSSTSGVIMQ